MLAAVWKIGATVGGGWVREMYGDGPLVTANETEAMVFPDRATAVAVLRGMRRTAVRWQVLDRPHLELGPGEIARRWPAAPMRRLGPS